jgi:hypothetical protein
MAENAESYPPANAGAAYRSPRRFQHHAIDAIADLLQVPALDQCADRGGDILHRHAERVRQLLDGA